MPRITLTGYIYRSAEGMFVSHCNELDTDTWAPTLEEAKRLTPDMIETYFLMAQKMGMLESTLSQLASAEHDQVPVSSPEDTWRAAPANEGMRFATQFEGAQAAA